MQGAPASAGPPHASGAQDLPVGTTSLRLPAALDAPVAPDYPAALEYPSVGGSSHEISRTLTPIDERAQDSPAAMNWSNLPRAELPTRNPAGLGEQHTTGDGDVEAVLAASTYQRAERIFGKLKPAKAKKKLKALVVRVRWKGNGKDRSTAKQFRNLAKRADKATRSASRGKYGVAMTVTPWTTIPKTSCASYSTLANRAMAAAGKLGSKYSPRKYDRVVVYFKQTEDCFWAGLAQTPGTIMWLNGSRYTSVFVHELAHTFGAGHANYVSCSKSRTLTARYKGCQSLEYGDVGDLMGAGPTAGATQGAISRRIGWLAGSRAKVAGRAKQAFAITPRASSRSGIKTVKVAGKKSIYWIEYRTRTGMDKVLTKDLTGVTVNVASGVAKKSPFVLDMQPQNGYEAVALPVGASWTSPDGVRITVRKLTAKKATVMVQRNVKAAKKPSAPAAPAIVAGDLSARITAAKGRDNGAPVQRWQARAVPLDGGATVSGKLSTGIAKSFSGVLGGLRNGVAYNISVRTFNERGWSPFSRATVVTPLPNAPVVEVRSPAAGQPVAGSIPIDITARSRGIGAANVVSLYAYLDYPWSTSSAYLSQHGNAGALSISRTMPLNNLPDGSYTMRFVATDARGRTTVAVRTITVTNQSPTVTISSAAISGNTLTVKFVPQQQVNELGVAVIYLQRKAGGPLIRSAALATTPGAPTTWSYDMSGLPAGDYLVDVLVTDAHYWIPADGAYPYPHTWGVARAQASVTR